jgi:hypothetical protein
MNKGADPLLHAGFDPYDLRWTLRDIAARRTWLINKEHQAKLIELGLVAMRGNAPYLTEAGQEAAWD